MKIAIATDDWEVISTHLSCCKGFAIFDLEGSRIKCQEYRSINCSLPGKKLITEKRESRNNLYNALLQDCHVIIVRVTEEPIFQALLKRNIKVFQTQETLVESALDQYLLQHQCPQLSRSSDR